MRKLFPTTVRSRAVTRPVNAPGHGGGSPLSDRENPRWRSATGSTPVHRVRAIPARPSVGMPVGKFLANDQLTDSYRRENE